MLSKLKYIFPMLKDLDSSLAASIDSDKDKPIALEFNDSTNGTKILKKHL